MQQISSLWYEKSTGLTVFHIFVSKRRFRCPPGISESTNFAVIYTPGKWNVHIMKITFLSVIQMAAYSELIPLIHQFNSERLERSWTRRVFIIFNIILSYTFFLISNCYPHIPLAKDGLMKWNFNPREVD